MESPTIEPEPPTQSQKVNQYGDPMFQCSSSFIERLKELKQYDLETGRQEQM